MADRETRTEHDLIGDLEVPAAAYYGIHTARATENFRISGLSVSAYPDLVNALAAVKQAAAQANRDLGLLDRPQAEAIAVACADIRQGRLHDQFVVDVIQGGAGTSTNMNANEVIANRGLEHLDRPRGDYVHLHPLEHVNLGQSTNDVYPTAIKLALISGLRRLRAAMSELAGAFRDKSVEFAPVLKMGRTQLQDAVPMTLGQEFSAYAIMLEEDRQRLAEATELLLEINLGGTAIGTGINTHPDYAQRACTHLAQITGIPVRTANNLVEATQDAGGLVQLSGVLKRVAVKLSKTCNDLRLTSSGPRAGLNEINLPAVQAGSSIMPGKVNPVIPEVVNQVAFEVIGNDVTVTLAAEAGQLQLNAFEPIIVHSLLKSLAHLAAACHTLDTRCVSDITANREHLDFTVRNSIGLITALSPYLGYANATTIAQQALSTDRTIADLVIDAGLLSQEQLDTILQPEQLTQPRQLSKSPDTGPVHGGIPAGKSPRRTH
jgi:aspartate ammonia-lyase